MTWGISLDLSQSLGLLLLFFRLIIYELSFIRFLFRCYRHICVHSLLFFLSFLLSSVNWDSNFSRSAKYDGCLFSQVESIKGWNIVIAPCRVSVPGSNMPGGEKWKQNQFNDFNDHMLTVNMVRLSMSLSRHIYVFLILSTSSFNYLFDSSLNVNHAHFHLLCEIWSKATM